MIRVRAASRLHFGLFTVPSESEEPRWPNVLGEQALAVRQFGGVGLMVQSPSVQVRVERADSWSADGPSAERALQFARQFAQTLPSATPAHIVVEHAPSDHVGLGTGTQLGLSVARALSALYRRTDLTTFDLARLAGRGRRSALGIHGFAQGGFLVEAGKRRADDVGTLIARQSFPEDWLLVLVLPSWGRGLHSTQEIAAFAALADHPQTLAQTDALCRLVLLGMLPALQEHDLSTFSEALFDFNRRVGELFAPVQGGAYAHAQTADLVAFLRRQGIAGVGQSSWGPTVFAVVEGRDQAESVSAGLRRRFALTPDEVIVTSAANEGAYAQALA